MISFNKPYYPALGKKMILETLESGKISGDGFYNKKVTDFGDILCLDEITDLFTQTLIVYFF